MKAKIAVLLLALFLFLLPLDLQALESGTVPLRRFALVIGANDGGGERITLQYAGTDARSFARVMSDLGGVKEQDLILLLNPDLGDFQTGLKELKRRVVEDRSSRRKELIIYYSGHSDEEGLMLGEDRYSYADLRVEIGLIPTDVRIAILDSCASGAMTRAKGGAKAPAFLMDVANTMTGHAFLTSSSADEASQESDTIEASFFTHYLLSGLRGAADASGEGVVTLTEAYNFAYHETLASTEKSQYGPQHPNWDISLSGTGDLVLTDLRNSSSGLVIARDLEGRIFVRDKAGSLVAELNKTAGQEIMLALEPGTYRVVHVQDDIPAQADVLVTAVSRPVLTKERMRVSQAVQTIPRGGEPSVPAEAVIPDPAEEPPVSAETPILKPAFQPFRFSIAPELPLRGLGGATTVRSVSLNLLLGYSAAIRALELSLVGSVVSNDVSGFQAALAGNLVGGNVIGFQTAGLVNYVGGDVRFVQTSTGGNYVEGSSYGFQAATLFNYTGGKVGGLQAAGIVNFGGDVLKGLQASGITNLAIGGFAGVQLSGILNIGGRNAVGAQASSILNFNKDDLTGIQLAAVTNYGGSIRGAQLSLVNVSPKVDGVQIGLVNIAGTVRGTQIGLINISNKLYGIPVGLLNFEKEGQQHLDLWRTNDDSTHLAFRVGSRFLYTILTGSYRPGEMEDSPIWSYGAGMGGHIPLSSFFVNLDVLLQSMQEGFDSWYLLDSPDLLPELRIYTGIQSRSGFGLYIGLSYLMFVPGWYSDPKAEPEDQGLFHLRPRAFIGIQL